MLGKIGALGIAGDTTVTAGQTTTPANIAIPNMASGQRANYVYVAVSALAAVKPGFTGSSDALAAMARVAPETPVVLNVAGYTHLRIGAHTGTADIAITPLENQ
jgi:hypothetical protein